jgi:antitoxin VapB
VRIPRGFEPPGDEVIIRKEGDRLIIEPKRKKKKKSLKELFASWQPLDEELPDPPDPPPEPVEF